MPELSVAEVIGLYLGHLRARVASGDYTPHAFADTQRELERFARRYGGQMMHECRRHDLTEWLDSNPQWRSNHTRKRVLGTLIRPFLWAEDEQLITATPYRRPKKLRLRTQPRRAAEEREYVLLMRYGSRPLRRALFFLRHCGGRPQEMRELLWIQVHEEHGYVHMRRHKGTGLQDDAAERVFGLDPCLARFLANLRRQNPPGNEHVFLNAEGQPWATRQVFARHLKRWVQRIDRREKAAGRPGLALDLCAYMLRHFFTTGAVEADVGERAIADQLATPTRAW